MKYLIVLFAFFCSGCAEVKKLAGGSPEPAPEEAESGYAAISLRKALDHNSPGPERVRLTLEYRGTVDTMLDLPDDFHRGWVRISASEPGQTGVRTSNIVVPEDRREFFTGLRPGGRFELLAWRVRADDVGFLEGGPGVVLRAVRLSPAGRGVQAAAAEAPSAFPPGSLYRNGRSSDEFIFLGADGVFRIRDRGREVSGLYERAGKTVRLKLPNGRTAEAEIEGRLLTDPEGKPWRLSEQ